MDYRVPLAPGWSLRKYPGSPLRVKLVSQSRVPAQIAVKPVARARNSAIREQKYGQISKPREMSLSAEKGSLR